MSSTLVPGGLGLAQANPRPLGLGLAWSKPSPLANPNPNPNEHFYKQHEQLFQHCSRYYQLEYQLTWDQHMCINS